MAPHLHLPAVGPIGASPSGGFGERVGHVNSVSRWRQWRAECQRRGPFHSPGCGGGAGPCHRRRAGPTRLPI
ncbi:hypothetical protein Y1Q_0000429 [Alligator mississippiensis]|uniref:Uncharacterized protein n=1 Tax=Alligator mississippiensis TaxID=8496 RepID=A0A151MB60_ALLMI|nr:hypothetical protein Y1Q_0000429 [Alligator mississippiensis]